MILIYYYLLTVKITFCHGCGFFLMQRCVEETEARKLADLLYLNNRKLSDSR